MAKKIGVVFVSMDEKTEEILSYLITHQNCLQTSFEFCLVPCPSESTFLDLLQRKPGPSHEEAAENVEPFVDEIRENARDEANAYGLGLESIDKIVMLSDTRFSDNYYYIGCPQWSLIALGGWQEEFAPPSLIEYYLSILVTSALDSLGAGVQRHALTRGCIFDFNASLSDKRLSVLSGYICPMCAARLETRAEKQFIEDARRLLKREWLGTSRAPSDVAITVKKLGSDLFHTTDVKPTLKERLLTAFEQEGVKNILTFTFQLLLAIAVVVIGLKR